MRLPVAESPAGKGFDRLIATLFVAAAIACVVVLGRVHPDARGHGTHEQLGLPRCAWPALYDRPCPTCGVTTAATHLVHLHVVDAVRTQPFGVFVAGLGLWLAAVAAWSLVRGESFVARLATLPYGTLAIASLVLLLGSWGYTWWTWPRSAG